MTGQPSGWGADIIQGAAPLAPPPLLAPALSLCNAKKLQKRDEKIE